MKTPPFLTVLLVLTGWQGLGGTPSAAGQLSTYGSSGTGTYSQTFAWSHREETRDSPTAKLYSASYTFTRTEVGSTTGANSQVYNQTHAISGGIGFIEDWRYGGRITYADTPAEFLSSFGAGFYGAWDFNIDEEKRTGSFSKPWGLRADAGYTDYSLNLGGSRPLRRSGSGSSGSGSSDKTANLRIGQLMAQGSAWLEALEWLNLRISHTRFFYSQNVANFMAVLDDPRAIASGTSQFGYTLAGFSSRGWDVGIDLTAPAQIYFSLGGSAYQNASSDRVTRGLSVDLSKRFGRFLPGISWERYVSSGASQDLLGFSLSLQI